ncbi:MAG: ABC-type transport auxiliary lipoprotein family protein [Victivallales bacterium]|jgi:outer membrane lipoprotein-sorting protein|nr:ABC-type transport auxiliary lipoprotein family protein [Victivallales bacterium]
MKKLYFCALLLPLLAGCAFMSVSYIEPTEHDLKIAENPLSEIRFEIGTFRNLSGSDRRFLYQEKNGQMVSDDYNRWLLTPDLMMERSLHSALSPSTMRQGGRDGTFARISGTIYRFDFDRQRRMAVLFIDYNVRVFVDRKPIKSESLNVKIEEPINGNTSDAATAAMSVCMDKSVAAVRQMLINVKDAK